MNISATKLQVTPETKKYLVVQNSHILLQLSNSLFEMKSKQLLIFKTQNHDHNILCKYFLKTIRKRKLSAEDPINAAGVYLTK